MSRFCGLLLSVLILAAAALPLHAATSVPTQRITITPNADYKAPETAPTKTPLTTGETPSEEAERLENPETAPAGNDESVGASTDTADLPEIHYDEEGLPEPVRRMRQAILDAARSGDPEALRPVLESNEVMPTLSFGDFDDPIAYLKQTSGDDAGQEILAILTEVMEAGWVHVDVGTPQEKYIWPYFASYPLDKLTAPQMVELYRIVTAADVQEMRTYGAYIFYRVGIGPDGTWHFFVAGD